MKKRFIRLKLKMLLMVVLGALAAGGVGLLALDFLIDGVLQDPFANLFVWIARHWFGQTLEESLQLYQSCIQANKPYLLTGGMVVLMLAAFYIAMGRFVTYLNHISAAVRQVVNETGEPVVLPAELEPVENDLNGIQRTLRAREQAARDSEQRKNDLVAYLAHDLKTPLTSVLGYLTLLRDEPDLPPDLRAKYTGIALEKSQRLEELISEFFDISRMDLQNGGERETIHLSMLLEQLADEFYPLFGEKQLTCRVNIVPGLQVAGDPGKLARVFDNVLRNAVSYSQPGTEVELTARSEEGWAAITISNEGLEIPEGELASIFQKFYRLDEARSTRTGGAGLGLAIAREIVENHGGTIQAESTGKRTVFTIRLPTC
ncbi:MAG: HAMP domain-containing histidine kinase [Oscillospiraceae bacterium]|nr:HAMP domain-containing histidine kinase [Oscillospiraceae bacterium]